MFPCKATPGGAWHTPWTHSQEFSSQFPFPWWFSPRSILVWGWFFLTSFTDNISDTILLHNEVLNCRQSKSSKAEQTALIIFFKYCHVGMKVFGSHNAFFYCLKHEWVQRNSSTMRTIQCLFHRGTNALSEQTLLSTFTRAEVEEEPSLQTLPQPIVVTTIILPTRNQLKKKKQNKKTLAYTFIYIHTKWCCLLNIYSASTHSLKQQSHKTAGICSSGWDGSNKSRKKSSQFKKYYTTGTIKFVYWKSLRD